MLAQEIVRLRKLRELDTKAYKTLKTRLPYFVGSCFEDGHRISDKFLFSQYLTIDVDDYLEDGQQIPSLVLSHPMVLIAFISPSGTGFKAVFKLENPCNDLIQYKEFYRNFSRVFAENIHLSGSIDMKTCDATRACFLSHDPNAFFNSKAENVVWQNYIERTTPSEIVSKHEPKIIKEEKLDQVLHKINPKRPHKKEYQGYVPEALKMMSEDIERICVVNNLNLEAILPISYGIKIQVKQGYRSAEINVFYGKKGFTLTRSPKSGTDSQLAEILYCVVHDLIFPPIKLEKTIEHDWKLLIHQN